MISVTTKRLILANPTSVTTLVDCLSNPRVIVILNGADIVVHGELRALVPAMRDLLEGRIRSTSGWPSASMLSAWEEHGSPHLFFDCTSLASWRAARLAGFETRGHRLDNQVAYLWKWSVDYTPTAEVRHPCRVLEPLEGLEHIKRGLTYGRDSTYVADCLKKGPSFVCELPISEAERLDSVDLAAHRVDTDDKLDQLHQSSPPLPQLRPGWIPVCWAATHLNGTMGMLYTLPAFRRSGCASSLAAFQIRFMLERDKEASSHILDDNQPSMELARSLGGRPDPHPLVWRVLYWPRSETVPTTSTQKIL